jgi:two-component system, response regulator
MASPPLKPILHIEDNPDDVELTEISFAAHNLADRLVVARDGVEALDLLTGEHAGEYAFVLLDLKLPRIDGLEVLRHIRSDPRTKTLPVVILTSAGQQEDIAASYRDGANSYVRKPIDFAEFSTAVAQLALFWAVLNEPLPPAA